MKIINVPLNQAEGHILLHHQLGPDGRRVLKKGTVLTGDDIESLQALGKTGVYVATLDKDDVPENEAARRLARRLVGPGLEVTSAATGRVNLMAASRGLFKVDAERLLAFNSCPGITLGTIPTNTVVQPKRQVGTLKVIPYSVPRPALAEAEAIAGQIIAQVVPFIVEEAVLITTGSPQAQDKVIGNFTAPLQDRLSSYGTQMDVGPYVPEEVPAIASALFTALDQGFKMILVAGETSIMDENDITPQAIQSIGGQVVQHGVPVEPGNLLLLAYYGDVPIVGAPGCARSKNYNVVDMILPRLAAGERLTSRDLMALGHGGLVK